MPLVVCLLLIVHRIDDDSAVTALYKGTTRNGSSVLLRSYDSRKEPPPEFDCTVWQAGRATSATGLAFKPIQIGQHFFIDEGPGTYNPAPQVLEEAAVNEWPGREVGVFISVGTGRRPAGTNNRQHEWWEDFFGDTIGVFAEARRRLITKIEGCEDIHHDMLRDHLAKRNVSKDNYYRLNVEVGVGEFGMNEWNRLADISTNTRRYLSKPDVKKMILGAGVKFAKINRMHQRLSTHGVGAASNADASSIQEDSAFLTPHSPTYAVPPPSNPVAVELPAELPGDFTPLPTSTNHPAHSEDSLPAHPTPQDAIQNNNNPHPHPARGSGSDISSFCHSHDRSRPTSQQQHHHPQPSFGSSPRHSNDFFNEGIPPPVPPKTPIPYPDDPAETGGIMMPVPDTVGAGAGQGTSANGKIRPPYPVDEPPPVVNRHRKPSYHVR